MVSAQGLGRDHGKSGSEAQVFLFEDCIHCSCGTLVTEHQDRANPKPPPVDRLSQVWRRINDHKMVQWSVAYVAVAYAIQHGVTLTSEAFDWPHAMARVSMLLLTLGLPVVMTFAWYHGERSSRHFSTAEMTIVSLLLVIGSIVFYAFVQPHQEAAASVASPQQQTSVQRGAAATPHGGISLAVLPFVNLSSDKDQEFFSDGMTDEITSALAKVRDLSVVGRSSAFQFKGEKKDLRAIGQALSARYLIDGSVRKAGDRVRITAQLIEAGNGVQLWSENYDRELKDVFAVQEDIAQAIAVSLRVPLGLQQGENLVSNRTGDLEFYQQYLRASALYRARALNDAIAILEPLVGRDPNYAPAWALLAGAYQFLSFYEVRVSSGPIDVSRRVAKESLDKGEKAAREAIRLDPRRSGGYSSLAYIQGQRKNWMAADDLFRQALALDPDDPEALHLYGLTLASVGRLNQALSVREHLRLLEPFVPVYNIFTALVMQLNGKSQATVPLLEAVGPGGATGFYRNINLARAYASVGRFNDAAETLLAIPANQNAVSRRSVEDAARLLRGAPERVSAPEALPVLEGELNFVYVFIGAPNRALETPERWVDIGLTNGTEVKSIFHPIYGPLRKTERFKTLMRNAGLLDYWRAKGWPEFCHPTTGDDFECN